MILYRLYNFLNDLPLQPARTGKAAGDDRPLKCARMRGRSCVPTPVSRNMHGIQTRHTGHCRGVCVCARARALVLQREREREAANRTLEMKRQVAFCEAKKIKRETNNNLTINFFPPFIEIAKS